MSTKTKVAIIGSGNIGTDLMIKVMRRSNVLEMGALVGIDPESDGLKRAQRLGVAVTHEGIEGLQRLSVWPEIGIVFDARSEEQTSELQSLMRTSYAVLCLKNKNDNTR